jgi:hypothetical protein
LDQFSHKDTSAATSAHGYGITSQIATNSTVENLAMSLQVLDSPDPRHVAARIQTLKAQGLQAAILYISPINLAGDKTAKKPAIDAIRAAGVDIGFVCEGWGGSNNFSHHDINAACGARDGATCGKWLEQLGAPRGTAVYPTVDNDASTSQIASLCLPYFTAFRESLSHTYAMGVYGCGALIEALDAAMLIDYRWLSNAMGWNGSRAYRDSGKWDILQGLATHAAGIDIDPDRLNPNRSDFGFWKAGAS